jgi:site-specific DNA recombinase
MSEALSDAGAAGDDVVRVVRETWIETALKAGIDLTNFRPDAPLVERLSWALSVGLDIAAILSRYSSKMQHSTDSQCRDCAEYAAWHRFYVPPEFVCIDEAVSGRKSRRAGLQRMKDILNSKQAKVLLVFKLSRLFRVAYKGFQFFQEDVVEEGLRGISISQGIDTADSKIWKALCVFHGLMDDLLLETIADHVRSGQKTVFNAGWVVGALTLGYRPVEVVGAPRTNRDLPRTMPQKDQDVAALIHQHYEWIRDGLAIRQGWIRWVQGGGPCDKRSPKGCMSYSAYRRMLSNPRYTGRWAFGRTRSRWVSKRDYSVKDVQPDTEVVFHYCEELRIVEDELFFAVQRRLEQLKKGPRGPKRRKEVHLWDLVTEVFFCSHCNVRFYQGGPRGTGMFCKLGDLCPCKTVVQRKEAVQAVCRKLGDLIQRDALLIEEIITRAREIDVCGDEAARSELAGIEKRIASLSNKIKDLTELAGQGTEEDRRDLKGKIQAAQAERAGLRVREAELHHQLDHATPTITAERVREILSDLRQLLEDAASGKLGQDSNFRAARVFRQLVGERIAVHVEQRAARKRTNARGVFRPELIRFVQSEAGASRSTEGASTEVEVWLRKPPKLDELALLAYELIDVQGLSYRDAAKVLQAEGHKLNSGIAWQARQRYYEMMGKPMPKRPFKTGRRRKEERRSA